MKKIIFVLGVTLTGIIAAFAADRELTFDELFEKVSHIDRFEVLDFNGSEMGFPDNLGKGVLAIHPNAEPREEIIALLDQLPRESLVYDNTNGEGRFDRFFREGDSTLLFVHVGHGTGDTAVILFKGGRPEDVNDFINRINIELTEHNI
ncbi:MAG: hypothetical protein K1V84_09825 [Muribaculaceae bacterium]